MGAPLGAPAGSQDCNLLKVLVGERGFEPPTPWSRTWGRGADFVNIQSFEWCFDRLSLARSRQFGRNVNPPFATLARVSFHLGSRSKFPTWRVIPYRRLSGRGRVEM